MHPPVPTSKWKGKREAPGFDGDALTPRVKKGPHRGRISWKVRPDKERRGGRKKLLNVSLSQKKLRKKNNND